MYELLVKGGTVIDPAQRIHEQMDVAISEGKVATLAHDIASSEVKKVIDARGMLVTPGLIDFHCHVVDGIINLTVAPDDAGILSGVTTVNDAGSTGHANFAGFRKFVIAQARTDVFCFLHMCSTGLAIIPELWDWRNIDTEAMLKTIEENRDIIKGIKIRASGSVIQNLGVEAVRAAKKVAKEARLPFMIHIGIDHGESVPENTMSVFTKEMLSILDKGDILAHIYTFRAGGVIRPDGTVLPELKEAIARGIILDVAHTGWHWSAEIALKGMEQGILPTTLSTDLNAIDSKSPAFNLLATISRFLALGLSLDQVVEMTTVNPARILDEEQRRGTLGIGMPADVSILEPNEGDYTFTDGEGGNTFKGDLLLLPKLTIKNGVEIAPSPRAREMVNAFSNYLLDR